MARLPDMRSFFDPKLRISLEVPEGWKLERTPKMPLAFFAPEEADYSSNLSIFFNGMLKPPTLDRFNAFIQESLEQQQRSFAGYRLIEETRISLDECPAYARRYEWQPEGSDLHFSQMLVLVMDAVGAIHEVHGATLKSLEAKYLPIFWHMVQSIRFIPAKPDSLEA